MRMTFFERELERVLAEMAELAGWYPTRRQRYLVSYNGKEQDAAYGGSPEEAIRDYLGDDGGERMAGFEGVPVAEYVAGLTATLEEPTDGDGLTDFRTRDIKLINADKTRRTLETWLNANPTPYRFIIKFGDGTKTEPTPGVITYVKEGNAGGDALTPHMILHTLGHAIMAYQGDDEADAIGMLLQPSLGYRASDDDLIIPLSKLLHMKAAELTIQEHPRGFPTFQELLYEVLAVFVKNGRVKVAPNKHCDFQVTPEVCASIKHILEKSCQEMLDRAVGRVVYDD